MLPPMLFFNILSKSLTMKFFYASLLLLFLAQPPAHADILQGVPEFIDEMVARHHFKREQLESVFARVHYVPSVIDIISHPTTARPWLVYRASFVNPQRIKLGLEFWKKYRSALKRAEREYGVPEEIILAVIGVETIYGQDAGTFRTVDALTTLAFAYPSRAAYFRSELENLLLLAREQKLDVFAIRGSYAGALGMPQFMPSNYRSRAVDFNGNHRINLMHEAGDVIGSVANYLKSAGWVRNTGGISTSDTAAKAGAVAPVALRAQVSEETCAGDITTPRSLSAWAAAGIGPLVNLPLEQIDHDPSARLIDFTVGEEKEFWLVFNNFEVIKRYNNSDFYAMSVFQLAQALKEARKPESP